MPVPPLRPDPYRRELDAINAQAGPVSPGPLGKISMVLSVLTALASLALGASPVLTLAALAVAAFSAALSAAAWAMRRFSHQRAQAARRIIYEKRLASYHPRGEHAARSDL